MKMWKPSRRALLSILAVPLALGLASTARAGEGRIEINQASALAGAVGGSLALDGPGFPVDLHAGGSYVLTGDLVVTDANTDAIRVFAGSPGGPLDPSGFTLDLNGFSIRGPATCSGEGTTLSCGGSSSAGIFATSDAPRAIVIHNGRITGFSTALAIFNLKGGCIVRNLEVIENVTQGISIIHGNDPAPRYPCLIRDNVVKSNGGHGIQVGGPAILTGNVLHGNRLDGIHSERDGVAIHGNTLHSNGERGIFLPNSDTSHVLVSRTAIEGNGLAGVEFGGSSPAISLLVDDTIRGNGFAATPADPQLKNACGRVAFVHQVLSSGASGGPPTTTTPCGIAAMTPNLCNGSTSCP